MKNTRRRINVIVRIAIATTRLYWFGELSKIGIGGYWRNRFWRCLLGGADYKILEPDYIQGYLNSIHH